MQTIQIGPYRITYRPRHFAGGLWAAVAEGLGRVYLSQAEAMEWYAQARASVRFWDYPAPLP